MSAECQGKVGRHWLFYNRHRKVKRKNVYEISNKRWSFTNGRLKVRRIKTRKKKLKNNKEIFIVT